MAVNDYTLQVILKAHEEGMAAFAAMNAKLAELVAVAEMANRALERLDERGKQHTNILRLISDDTLRTAEATARMADSLDSKLTPAVNRAAGAAGNGRNNFIQFLNAILPGGTTAVYVTLAIAGLAAAFGPLTAELAASLVMLGAWVVGATAFAAVIGIAVGGIALLAAGIAYLGIQQMGGLASAAALTKAQNQATSAANANSAAQEALAVAQLRYNTSPTQMNLLNLQHAQEQATESANKLATAQTNLATAQQNAQSPIATLQQDIKSMADTLGQAAVPMAAQMIIWVDSLIPKVQALGQSLIDWFGPRLPQVLTIAGQAADNLFRGLDRIGVAWGQVIDHALSRSPEFGNILNGAFNRAIDGAVGLLDNLVKLSDWFVQRLPTLGPVVNSTFGNIGIVIQAVGHGLGAFVDWVIAAWPSINHAFNETWKVIQEGWSQVSPMFSLFKTTLDFLKPTLQDIASHLYLFKPLLELVAAALLIIIGVVYLVMVVLIALAALLTVVAFVLTKLVEYIISQIPVAGAQFSAFGKLVHDQLKEAGDQMSALGTTAHGVLDFIKGQLAVAGAQFSALGSAVQVALGVIGAFFSAVGTAVHNAVVTFANGVGAILTVILTVGAVIFGAWLVLNQALLALVKPIWDAIAKVIGDVLGVIWTTIVTVWNTVFGFLATVWNAISATAAAVWNAITGVITSWLGRQQTNTSNTWNQITTFLNSIWNFISALASTWWARIWNTISFWLNTIWTTILSIWNVIRGFLEGAWNSLNGLAQSWWGTIRNTIVNWVGNIRDTVQGIWNGMLGQAGAFFNNLYSAVKNGVNSVIGVFDVFIDATNSALHPVLNKDVVARIPKLAKGGVIPGYAPGQDTVPALLSPGEGVIRPEMVRQLGGASTIDAINNGQMGAGIASAPGVGATSGWGGQCVPFVERALGIYWPVAYAKQLTAYVNSQTAKANEAAVFTGGSAGHVALVTGPGDGFSFPVIDSNWVAFEQIGQHVMNKSMYGFAGFIDTGKTTSGGISGLLGGLASSASAALNGIIDGALNGAKSLIGGVPAWIRDFPGPVLGQVADALKNQLASLFAPGVASSAPGAPTVGGNLGSWIQQAIALTGVPTTWTDWLSVLIGRESGGNPNAINRTDINAILGHPSQGLMQLIPSNFAAYHVAGTANNILDPIANIAAGIKYILARYGTIFNVQQANAALPPKGYDSGGNLPTGLSYVWNGTGRTEPVLGPNAQDDIAGMRGLLREVLAELRILNGRQRSGAQTAVAQMG